MDLKEARLTGYVVQARHPWELARREVVADLIRRHVPAVVGRPARVLDLGCGDTWLIEQLAQDLPAAHFAGVDIAFPPQMVENLNRRYAAQGQSLRVYDQLAAQAAADPGPVDLVLLLDVIEHIEDEIGFLREMAQHPGIGPDTRVLITVPAFQQLFCAHDTFLAHYRRYTLRSLRQRTSTGGLACEAGGYFFATPLLPRAIRALAERVRPPQGEAKGIGAWAGGPALTRLLYQGLRWDYRVGRGLQRLGLRLPGLSVFMVGRPNGGASGPA